MLSEINRIHKVTLLFLMIGICLLVYQTIKVKFINSSNEYIEIEDGGYRIIFGTVIISVSELIEIILLTKHEDQLAYKIFVTTLTVFIVFGLILILLHIKTYFFMFTFQWDSIEEKEFYNFYSIMSNLVVCGVTIITSSASLIILKIITQICKHFSKT